MDGDTTIRSRAWVDMPAHRKLRIRQFISIYGGPIFGKRSLSGGARAGSHGAFHIDGDCGGRLGTTSLSLRIRLEHLERMSMSGSESEGDRPAAASRGDGRLQRQRADPGKAERHFRRLILMADPKRQRREAKSGAAPNATSEMSAVFVDVIDPLGRPITVVELRSRMQCFRTEQRSDRTRARRQAEKHKAIPGKR